MATCLNGHESASDDFCDVCGILIGAPSLSSIDPGPGGSGIRPGPGAGSGAGAGTGPGSWGDGLTVPGVARAGHTLVAETCPRCGAPRDGQFCEDCGWNFADGTAPAPDAAAAPDSVAAPAAPTSEAAPPVPAPPVPASPDNGARVAGAWSATVTADRAYYETVLEASGPDAAIDFPAYCPERRFRLSGSEMRIGRRSASRGIEPEIDLSGPPVDPGVSRLHAVLIADSGGDWSVLDPGSANGTLVNGQEIQPNQPVTLREGDRVNLGAWTLLVVSRDN